jgi:hypothetical protein
MVSKIDFAVATGLFILFWGVLIVGTMNYLENYRNLATSSEMRTIAWNVYNALFASKGVPTNWQDYRYTPVKIGLITDLYRATINITETNGTSRGTITVNATINFDSGCERNIKENTVRLYDSDITEVQFQLYNQTYCGASYLKAADLAFALALSANQAKFFYVYFSSEKYVTAAGYSVSFQNTTNYTANVYPIEELKMVSGDKLRGLRNLTVSEVMRTVGYNFRVEVGE